MDTASKVLVTAGTLAIAVSFLLGIGLARRRAAAPSEPGGFLLVAHEGALFQGVMLLSLTFAIGFSNLGAGWETLAAWLLVAGAALNITAAVLNFRGGIRDQFAERSTGLRLNQANAVLATIGLAIVVVGVIGAL